MKSPAVLVDMDVRRALTQRCNATYFRGGIWMACASCSADSGADKNLKSMASLHDLIDADNRSGCNAASRQEFVANSDRKPFGDLAIPA